MLTLPIIAVVPATPRARIVRLGLNGHTFEFAAGQAVLIGTHGQDVRKPYSIASAPEDAQRDAHIELLIGVRENGAPGEHLTLEPGTAVDVEGPVGGFTFPLEPVERNFVFVAGGTGIAPLRAMLRHAILGRRQARHVGLLYSARTPDEFAFADEFRAMAADGTIDFAQTITRETDRDWDGHRGRITRDHLRHLVHAPDTLCFISGPRALVEDMPRLLEELGVTRDRIRIEEWG
ncbi:MAG TPA: FAD-binding oxidoreductase [Vicinamibacterales bacterium]|nr:FAD-binding oxidoreductase [Vicinamibacterales bacterium]